MSSTPRTQDYTLTRFAVLRLLIFHSLKLGSKFLGPYHGSNLKLFLGILELLLLSIYIWLNTKSEICFEYSREWDLVSSNISIALKEIDLTLDSQSGVDFGTGKQQENDPNDTSNTGAIALGILSTIFAIMFIFLAIAYFIRVRQ